MISERVNRLTKRNVLTDRGTLRLGPTGGVDGSGRSESPGGRDATGVIN